MLGYLSRAVPLEQLGKGGDETKEAMEDRLFAQRVADIRRFAMTELGLKENKNYTRYVQLDRDYLAAVVSASEKDSFNRFEWWFPIVGKVPYKGFFNVEDARRERDKLEKKDLDVWIRGVDAFSTLGWFRDPLYSYMKTYGERELAELIIHELFHATVFIKNQSEFNEGLANFVGNEGGRIYAAGRGKLEGEGGDEALADRAAYLAFISGLTSELDLMYESGISRAEKLRKKEEIIKSAKERFEENYQTLFQTENYRFFTSLPVNNAYLELFQLYHEDDYYFAELYEKSGSDLAKFIKAAITLDSRLKQGKGKMNQADLLEEFSKILLESGF